MSNPNQPVNRQGGSGPQPGQQQQRPPAMTLIRPEMVRNLPHLNASQKASYEKGIIGLWNEISNSPPDSQEARTAQGKLLEVSRTISKAVAQWRQAQIQRQREAQAQAQQQGQAGAELGQPPVQPVDAGNLSTQNMAQPEQEQQPQPKPGQAQPQPLPQQILTHIHAFGVVLPPNANIQPNSPEAERYVNEARQQYGKALHKAHMAKEGLQELSNILKNREETGKGLTAEEKETFNQKTAALTKMRDQTTRYVESFRQQQAEFKKAGGQPYTQPNSLTQQGQISAPDAAEATSKANAAVVAGTNRGSQQSPIAQQAEKKPGARPSIEQIQTADVTMKMAHDGPLTGKSIAGATNTSAQQVHTATPTQAAPSTNASQQATTAGLPSNPAALPQSQQAGPPQPSPQTAQPPSAAQTGAPRPLSHQDAIGLAGRSYTSGSLPSSTPTSANYPNHAHPTPTPRDISNTSKMPIPKNLQIQPPQPVTMSASRPTYSGGASNGGNHVMGQPALQKLPPFTLEGEGERVLSKKKLDELVRQVTGGGEGAGGEGLTAEVEEAVLQVADDFVDQVISSACKLAKLRQSSTLDIRDIQLILERNYNIRIPGYASDEIRAVRKFAPAQGWSQKMSAVQAAKVTGGKADM